MELAHHVADDARALDVPAVRLETGVVHCVEDTAMHGLQTVAHVRQGAPDDHAHGVVEVRRAHLLLEEARLDRAAGQNVRAISHSVSLLRGCRCSHYTSRLVTSLAWASMNSRRGSTLSPISIEKIWSAPAA